MPTVYVHACHVNVRRGRVPLPLGRGVSRALPPLSHVPICPFTSLCCRSHHSHPQRKSWGSWGGGILAMMPGYPHEFELIRPFVRKGCHIMHSQQTVKTTLAPPQEMPLSAPPMARKRSTSPIPSSLLGPSALASGTLDSSNSAREIRGHRTIGSCEGYHTMTKNRTVQNAA